MYCLPAYLCCGTLGHGGCYSHAIVSAKIPLFCTLRLCIIWFKNSSKNRVFIQCCCELLFPHIQCILYIIDMQYPPHIMTYIEPPIISAFFLQLGPSSCFENSSYKFLGVALLHLLVPFLMPYKVVTGFLNHMKKYVSSGIVHPGICICQKWTRLFLVLLD